MHNALSEFSYAPVTQDPTLLDTLRERLLKPAARDPQSELWSRVNDEQCLYDNVLCVEALHVLALCNVFAYFDATYPTYYEMSRIPHFGDWTDSITLVNAIGDRAESLFGFPVGDDSDNDEIVRLFTHARDDEFVSTIARLILQTIMPSLATMTSGPVYLLLDNAGTLNEWGERILSPAPEMTRDLSRIPSIAFGDSLTDEGMAGQFSALSLGNTAVALPDDSSIAFIARLAKGE